MSTDGVDFSPVFTTGYILSPTVVASGLVQNTQYYFQVFGASTSAVQQADVLGAQITVTTAIDPPGALSIGDIAADGFTLSWSSAPGSLARYYLVLVQLTSTASNNEIISFNDNYDAAAAASGNWTLVAVLPALSSTFNVTNVTASTTYTVWVRASLQQTVASAEPVGSKATVTTPAASTSTHEQTTPTGVIAAIVVVVVVVLLALTIAYFVYRHRLAKRQKAILENFGTELGNIDEHAPVSMIPDNVVIGYVAPHGSDKKTKVTSGPDATIVNTVLEFALPGFLLLDYARDIRPEKKLTEGGAGTIWRATLLDNQVAMRNGDRLCALKHLQDSEHLEAEQNLERFHTEVSILWLLSQHPNVIKLTGYTDVPKTIVTPLYKTDLFRYLHMHSDKGRLESNLLLHLVAGMASAVEAIHAMGIAHRDIKSSNVLLAEPKQATDPYPIPIVCDFGLSRNNNGDADARAVPLVNGFSPRYAPPEVFARAVLRNAATSVDDDKRSDIYALGATFWETLAREIPWGDMSNEDVEANVRSGQRLPAIRPDDPADEVQVLLVRIIDGCLEASSGRRPPAVLINSKLTDLVQRRIAAGLLPASSLVQTPLSGSAIAPGSGAAATQTGPLIHYDAANIPHRVQQPSSSSSHAY